MRIISVFIGVFLLFLSSLLAAGPHYSGGKITSLLASATDPAIRLEGNISPDKCDGGTYGWLYFAGTPEERNRLYSSALALSLSGKRVAVYTNSDEQRCRINMIQVTSGLN
jgi:hypothetical protein